LFVIYHTVWCIVKLLTPFGVNCVHMYVEKFSERLKELIGENSISSVASKIGIPQQTLSRYLHNQREIGLENLCKIANYFNEDLDYLTGRKDY